MKVKLLLFGEAVQLPKTSFGLGVGFISLFIDGAGFTTAGNDLGSLGYVFIETPEVDLGDVGAAQQQQFADLTNRVVTFEIKPNLFVRNGGIVHVSLKISTEENGTLVDHQIDYIAEDCTGVAVVTNALSFSANMSPLPTSLTHLSGGNVISDDDVVAIADAAPALQSAEAQA